MNNQNHTDQLENRGMINSMGRIIDKISDFSGHLSGFMIMGLSFLIVFDAVTRLLGNPVDWVYTVSMFVLLWFSLLSSPMALKADRHVIVDFLTDRFTERSKILFRIIGHLFGFLVICALGYYGVTRMVDSFVLKRVVQGVVAYPSWILYAVYPIALLFHVLLFIKKIYGDLRLLFKAGFKNLNISELAGVIIFIALMLLSIYLFGVNPAIGIFLICFLLIFAGVPVAFALGSAGIFAMFFIYNGFSSLSFIPSVGDKVFGSYVMLAVPMFVMGGVILSKCGLGEVIFEVAAKWSGRLPGGLGVATILASVLMSAMIGVSTAIAAAMAMIAIPTMLKHGYKRETAYGTVGGGAIGSLLPPSTGLVVFGFMTETSVADLFAAAMIPAGLCAIFFMLYVIINCKIGKEGTIEQYSWSEKFRSLFKALPALMSPILVLGGIYLGWFTPTEAAGIFVVYSLIQGFIYTKMDWTKIKSVVAESAILAGASMMIMFGGTILGQVFAHLRIPRLALEWISSLAVPNGVILLAILLLYIVLGFFLDVVTIGLLTIPVLYPLLPTLGLNVITYGVTWMIIAEIAHITPPVGLNLFMIKQVVNDKMSVISWGHIPYVIIMIIVALMTLFIPQLTLWLPVVM